MIGLALWHDDAIVARWSKRIVRGADGVLAEALAEILADAPAVGCIGVSIGPGTFTGLRVGVATAVGLAEAIGVPVVPWSSLQVRAGLAPGRDRVLSVLDARKGRVYAGLFDTRNCAELVGQESDAALEAVLPGKGFVAVGEGACAFAEVIGAAGGRCVPNAEQSPAEVVAAWTAQALNRAIDPAALALRYLRPPDAKTIAQRSGTSRS